MAKLNILTLGSSKTYTKESLKGGGAIAGKNCTISSITPIDGGNRVTFSYTLDDGTAKNLELDVMNGVDGSIPYIESTSNNWFINGIDTGVKAKGEKGDTGSGFNTTRQYSSVSDMMADTNPANDSEIVVVVLGDVGNFYMRLSSYIDPDGVTNGYLPIGSAQDISAIKGDPGKDGKDGLTPHIDSATKHWFIGTADTGILAEGKNGSDGVTPHIGSNNHWFIGDTDTGVMAQGVDGADGKDGIDGADGRSITSITKDDNDNIVVTFSDGTTQNIGKLSVDISADFLTSGGFGNLRYYNDKLQYRDAESSAWVDIEATADNKLVINLSPQPMQKMNVSSDIDNSCYKITFKEPKDTILNGQLLVAVEGIKFVRKLGSEPKDIDDGVLVLDYKRVDFSNYAHTTYLDTSFTPNNGENWYYKAFPYSTNGFISNSSSNVSSCVFKSYYLYGFKIDQSESDPSSMIKYISTCDNAYYEPAHMDYTTGIFNYGDWEDAWFIRDLKPCMLKYDGTVGYELNKNDYNKKLDGTSSDIANTSYAGNAMIGIPKVYWKVEDNGDDTANIYFSDKKVDSGFKCWSHLDNNSKEIDYCYMPIFNGSLVDGRLRSLSDRTPIASKTASDEINYAKANNVGSDVIWYTELFNDRTLINLLLLLIGKSTDTQTVFGSGNNNSYVSDTDTGIENTGTMNKKGLFCGKQDNKSCVKVFGMEHWWGNQWRRIGGWINDKGTQKIKMTYGQSDGSTVDGYNLDGNGYITIANSTPGGTSGGYISKMLISENGLIPATVNGSATTYYCDGLWFNNSQVDYALVGGDPAITSLDGEMTLNLNNAPSKAHWSIGASLSCKPLAKSS